ncbi:unnamed protein product, partial [Iphiclides podalirius]
MENEPTKGEYATADRIGATTGAAPAEWSRGLCAAALHVTVRLARCSRRGHRLAVASPSYCLPDGPDGARCTAPLHRLPPYRPRPPPVRLPAPPAPTPAAGPPPAPPRRIFRIGREKSIVQRAPNNFGKTHGALATAMTEPRRPGRSSAPQRRRRRRPN